jgi:hypothetical protein
VGKRIVYSITPNRTNSALSIPELATAGAISAVPATLVAGPAERVKVLLQVSQRPLRKDITTRCLSTVYLNRFRVKVEE